MDLPITAFYFSLLLMMQQVETDVPILVGPYDEWEQCESVREYLDRRGYETDDCTLLPVDQEARRLEVIDIP